MENLLIPGLISIIIVTIIHFTFGNDWKKYVKRNPGKSFIQLIFNLK